MVGVRGNAPRSAPYQEAGLLLTYTPSEVWSGQRVPPPRSPHWQRGVLLARLWPQMFQGGSPWTGEARRLDARAGVEPAAAVSRTALRTDTECLAMPPREF